jgi:hypothetical protein
MVRIQMTLTNYVILSGMFAAAAEGTRYEYLNTEHNLWCTLFPEGFVDAIRTGLEIRRRPLSRKLKAAIYSINNTSSITVLSEINLFFPDSFVGHTRISKIYELVESEIDTV